LVHHAAHWFVGDGFRHLQFHQSVGQKVHRPMFPALRRRAAGQRHAQRLWCAVQVRLGAGAGTLLQRCFQPRCRTPLSDVPHGLRGDLEQIGNQAVGFPFG
jgi:hypothetical protein